MRRSTWKFLCIIWILAATSAAAQVCDDISPVTGAELREVSVITVYPDGVLGVVSPPGDENRFFAYTLEGRIYLWNRGSAPDEHSVFLDIDANVTLGGEGGLLGLAFDPNYASNGFFYVSYTAEPDGASVVSRFSVSSTDPSLADPTSELELLRIPQPASNHNGGDLAFGNDGFLYYSNGDGGPGGDFCSVSQDNTELLGTIMRIDPSGTATGSADCGSGAYTVPPNAIADGPGGDCDEIWAYGFRNAFRFDIDPANGDVYVGDVGEDCWEEVDWAPAGNGGLNFGWRVMEGAHCFGGLSCDELSPPDCGPAPNCNSPALTNPVFEYDRSGPECSVIGGKVYRGCRMPDRVGEYFFSDFCTGDVRSLTVQAGALQSTADYTAQVDPNNFLPFQIIGFGRDAQGEVYLAGGSEVRKLVPQFEAIEVSGPGAPLLQATGKESWAWEDVPFTNMVPVRYYRVYEGAPGGDFSCAASRDLPNWDDSTAVPPIGGLIAYLVTAVDFTDAETSAGTPARSLIAPCGPPF